MNRSRRLITTAIAVSVLGVGFAFATRLTGTARAAVGPIPPEALALPAGSSMVMGFDVRALTSSEFYSKFGGEGQPGRVEALAELERKTGLDPTRDIDSVVVAVQAQTAQAQDAGAGRRHRENAIIFVTGRFDAARLEASIPESGRAIKDRRDGVTIYREPTGKSNNAVALLDAGILIAGDSASIDAFLTNRQTGHGIRENKELVALLERVEPGSTFWAVGGPSVLSHITSQAGEAANRLPAIKQIVAYGHLDPEVGVTATAEASDEKSATKIADMLRGFSALLSLQAGQKTELAQIADSISVATEYDKVHVKATITHDLLESLKKTTRSAHKAIAEVDELQH